MNLELAVNWSTMAANVATLFGIVIAVVVFIFDRIAAQQSREEETYSALHGRYNEFLMLCLERQDLYLYDYILVIPDNLSDDVKRQRMVAMEMLVSMFEQAHFLYNRSHNSKFRARQWTGWVEYMKGWAAREDFKVAWQEYLGSQFDVEFVNYMNQLIINETA